MNSIGVCRFSASYVSVAFAVILGSLSPHSCFAGDCAQGLTTEERVAKFKVLDQQAEQAMHAHRVKEAIDFYQEAVCLVPKSARGLYGLGVAQAAAGDFLNAREALQAADSLMPNTPTPLVMQVRVNFSLHDVDALKGNLREAAERFPKDAASHKTLARFLAEKNLFVLALAEALRAEQAGSGDMNAKVQLAGLENAVGAHREAVRNALSIEQDPGPVGEVRASAAGIAGLSYESLGETEQAIDQLEKAIKFDPKRDNSYLALADLFDQLQKHDEAVRVLRSARENVPGSEAVLLPLGADLIRTEHYSEGVRLLHEVLRKDPQASEAYVGLADAARRTGNGAQEVEAGENLARLNPEYPMVHVLLARAMLAVQPANYQHVFEELSVAEKQTPGDPEVFALKGKTLFALGRYAEAVQPLQRAIELNALDPSTYYQLARVYQKLGKTDLAREQFERVKYLEASRQK